MLSACSGDGAHPFLATGEFREAGVWTSGDGIDWVRVDDPDLFAPGRQQMQDVLTTEGEIIAVGADAGDPGVWISTDGLEWEPATLPSAPGNERMLGVAARADGFVAVGVAGEPGEFDAAAWTSTDGRTWQRAPAHASFEGSGDQMMFDVALFDGLVIAVGRDDRDAAIWTSPDGLTWTRVGDEVLGGDDNQSVLGIALGGPGVIGVGHDGHDAAVWTSPDGSTWTKHTHPALGGDGQQWIRRVIAVGDSYVAVGAERLFTTINFLGTGGNSHEDAMAWVAGEDFDWQRVDSSAIGNGPGPTELLGIIPYGPGFLATGFDSGGGAMVDGRWVPDGTADDDWDGALWIADGSSEWSKVRSPAMAEPGAQFIWNVIEWNGRLMAFGGADTDVPE